MITTLDEMFNFMKKLLQVSEIMAESYGNRMRAHTKPIKAAFIQTSKDLIDLSCYILRDQESFYVKFGAFQIEIFECSLLHFYDDWKSWNTWI